MEPGSLLCEQALLRLWRDVELIDRPTALPERGRSVGPGTLVDGSWANAVKRGLLCCSFTSNGGLAFFGKPVTLLRGPAFRGILVLLVCRFALGRASVANAGRLTLGGAPVASTSGLAFRGALVARVFGSHAITYAIGVHVRQVDRLDRLVEAVARYGLISAQSAGLLRRCVGRYITTCIPSYLARQPSASGPFSLLRMLLCVAWSRRQCLVAIETALARYLPPRTIANADSSAP
jgi:hypothetical protein